ncbi:DUF5011 domain-containing protein [Oscillospiraceae bacterium OttesenSCG-928-G22]|nr:DUF5011 domain-containing protein [Oscillospiraceae bacterium OttesenSCG-928-G22]
MKKSFVIFALSLVFFVLVGCSHNPRVIVTETTIEAGSEYNILDHVETVFEYETLTVKESEIDSAIPGTYAVIFTAANDRGAESDIKLYFDVVDTLPPALLYDDPVVIPRNAAFEPRDHIRAVDQCEGELTLRVKIVENTVDTAIPGEYSVTVRVADSSENASEATIRVVVEA